MNNNQVIKWNTIHSTVPWIIDPSYEFLSFMAKHYWNSSKDYFTFLDLGCGTGASTLFLAKKGFKVKAVDISEVACKALFNNLSEDERSLVTIINKDVLSLELDDNSIDCVLLINLIDSYLEIEQSKFLLSKVQKWLRLKGRIFSTVLSNNIPKKFERDGLVKIRPHTMDELKQVFSFCTGSLRLVTNHLDNFQTPITNWVLDLEVGI